MKPNLIRLACLLTTLLALATEARAQGTAFTYQGRLTENGAPVNGSNDFTFTLYTAVSGGVAVGTSNVVSDLAVSNGLFTATLNFTVAPFDGSDRWLQIAVRPGASAGAYTNLAPRQPITPTPYAITAGALTGGVAAGQLTGTIPLARLPAPVLTNGASNVSLIGAFSGNGAGLTNVNAATLNELTSGGFWKTNGNTGANPANGAFLGTTDYQPLELKVNNQRGLRLEPTTYEDTVNVIGGSARNFVGAGVVGATIGGGGTGEYQGNPYTNQVGGDFGTVSGGAVNTILLNAHFATIGGGGANVIQTNAYFATIGGGTANTIQSNGTYATIAGGQGNSIYVNGSFSFIGGGSSNSAAGEYSTIGGGEQNSVQTETIYTTVGGGFENTIQFIANYATLGGGAANTIQTNAALATIGGGLRNTIQANALFATIPGGRENSAADYAFAAGRRAKANHTGAFVWGDSTDADFASTANNQFLIRASGNVGINKPNPASALDVNGTVTATGFRWAASSEFSPDQGGSLELGDSLGSGTVPFIDFHYGVGSDQDHNVRLINNADGVLSEEGAPGESANVRVTGSVVVDQSGLNAGNVFSNSLSFGTSSGEGIASRRSGPGGGNQYGLDFFTGFQDRMTILNNGNVGIGTTTPASALHVIGTVTATRFIGGSQNSADGSFATVGGGRGNTSSGVEATVGGGVANRSTNDAATVGGGGHNTAGGFAATVGGGSFNVASGESATVPGGDHNLAAGHYSFAAGSRAKANHTGALVWADAAGADLNSAIDNSVSIRASGGYRLFSDASASAGVSIAAGQSSWSSISDRNVKKDFASVDQKLILEKLAALSITQWHYKWESSNVTPHIGPMAQDFKAAFYPGTDDKTITTQEADGVALAAIQGLNQKVEEQSATLKTKDARITELERRLSAIETLLQK